jgi:hypothetical protein
MIRFHCHLCQHQEEWEGVINNAKDNTHHLGAPNSVAFGLPPTAWSNSAKNPDSRAPTDTLQKMIVRNGSVTIELDLHRLNGIKDLKKSSLLSSDGVRKIKRLA